MITFEALDVILRVQNLPGFMARMRAGARSVRGIGSAAVDTNKKASTAIYAAARKATLGLTAMAAITAATGFKQSVEFERQLTMVHTQAGATARDVAMVKQPLLDLAATTVQGPNELAKALFAVTSMGLPTKKALDVVKIAANGAAVGNADLEATTSALGAAWLVGIKGAESFHGTMATLNATVGAGNMRMADLITALGSGVLPTAKLSGLAITDVMAALALLTDEGYGAYGAMAQFATALHFFTSPTKKASDAFKRLGLSQLELSDTMRKRGMVATLQLLRERLKLTGDELARLSDKDWAPETQQEKLLGAILPGGRGRVFRVLLNQADRYQMKIDQITRNSGRYDKYVQATQATSAFRIKAAWSSVQVALVRLGDTFRQQGTGTVVFLIEAFAKFVVILSNIPRYINDVRNAWNGLPGPIKFVIIWISVFLAQFAVIRAATIALYLMKAAWISLRIGILLVRNAMWLLFLSGGPVGWILLGISLLITLMIVKWSWFRQAGINAFNWVKNAAVNTFNWFKAHWSSPLVQMLITPIGRFIQYFVQHWSTIKSGLISLWTWIQGNWKMLLPPLVQPFILFIRIVVDRFRVFIAFIKRAYDAIKGPMTNVAKWVGGAASDAWGLLTQPANQKAGKPIGIPGGWTGGSVFSSGFMDVGEHGRERIFLPAGSTIQPRGAGFRSTPGGSSGGGGREVIELHNHTYLDGKEITENVSHHMANKKARK